MCRWSSRGCTVIPGAPAARHVSTASGTLGTSPPRELRSVATLLTLTDRRIMKRTKSMAWTIDGSGHRRWIGVRQSSQRHPYRFRNFLGPRLNGGLILALDHDAQERFGAGVAHQQA